MAQKTILFDDEYFTVSEAQAKKGQRVQTKVPFSGVPRGTAGQVTGSELGTLSIKWDLPGRTKPLVDWFSKWEYEKYLEEIADD